MIATKSQDVHFYFLFILSLMLNLLGFLSTEYRKCGMSRKLKIESFMNISLLIQYTSYFRILKKYFKTLNNLCDGSGIILPLERKLSC
jgi:hypothetical protein